MSRNLGQVYFAHDKKGQFLIPTQERGGDYSEMTAHLIDKEIRQIIDEQYERALQILNANSETLNQTAAALLQSETIEGEELRALAKAVSQHSEAGNESKRSGQHQALAA